MKLLDIMDNGTLYTNIVEELIEHVNSTELTRIRNPFNSLKSCPENIERFNYVLLQNTSEPKNGLQISNRSSEATVLGSFRHNNAKRGIDFSTETTRDVDASTPLNANDQSSAQNVYYSDCIPGDSQRARTPKNTLQWNRLCFSE